MVAWHEVPGKVVPKRFRPGGTVRLVVARRETDLYRKRQFGFRKP
jgi:hypothetical protein